MKSASFQVSLNFRFVVSVPRKACEREGRTWVGLQVSRHGLGSATCWHCDLGQVNLSGSFTLLISQMGVLMPTLQCLCATLPLPLEPAILEMVGCSH